MDVFKIIIFRKKPTNKTDFLTIGAFERVLESDLDRKRNYETIKISEMFRKVVQISEIMVHKSVLCHEILYHVFDLFRKCIFGSLF